MERSYSNSYEPCLDVFWRLIKNIYEGKLEAPVSTNETNSKEPGFVTINTVPNNKKIGMIITHDLDGPSAFPNSVDFATSEADMRVKATYFVNTKYTRDSYDIPFILTSLPQVHQVGALGHELASHAIAHALDYATFPLGTGTEFFHYMSNDGSYEPLIKCTGPFTSGACPPGPQYCDYGEENGQGAGVTCGVYTTFNLTILGESRVRYVDKRERRERGEGSEQKRTARTKKR